MLTKYKGDINKKEKLQSYKGQLILLEDVGKNVFLQNGKEYFNLLISESMVGYYYYDFLLSKSLGNAIHVKKKKSKKKLKNKK